MATAVVALIGVGLFLGTHRARKAEEFLTQLRAKGEKLTYRELTGSDSVIANAAVRDVATAAKALGAIRYSPYDLDLSAYSRPGCVRVAWKQASVPGMQAGKSVGWDKLADYLEEAREPLAALREKWETATPEWTRMTNIIQGTMLGFAGIDYARWLSAAVISDLHANRLEQALGNLEALGALARADTLDYTLGSEIARIVVAHIGLRVTWQAWQAERWSDQQLERLQRVWEGVDLLEAAEHGLLGERAFGVSIWEQARRWNGMQVRSTLLASPQSRWTWERALFEWGIWPAYKMTSMDGDELFFLQTMEGGIDEIRQIRKHRPWDRIKSKAVFTAKMNQMSKPHTRWRYYISDCILSKYTEVLENAVRVETLRQLTLTAIAIKRYELRCKSPPPDLAALTPEYLRVPTYDPMSGEALRYQPGVKGGFLLYSIGEDGQDNGGDPNVTPGSKLGLWEGRDAVWPNAE